MTIIGDVAAGVKKCLSHSGVVEGSAGEYQPEARAAAEDSVGTAQGGGQAFESSKVDTDAITIGRYGS